MPQKQGKGKKGKGKRSQDPFFKKEWYDLRAPAPFEVNRIGRTVVTRTTGQKVAADNLKGRVVEVSYGDLKTEAEDQAFRKFSLKVEDVQGRACLTNFYGFDMATDKLKSLVKKNQTTIEAYVDVKTTDGFTLRVFCIGFTNRRADQRRVTSYAQASQVRAIRKKMTDIIKREVGSVELKDFVKKLCTDTIERDIRTACECIYPLHDVYIRKVKTVRQPKLDFSKLMELHGGASAVAASSAVPEAGVAVDRDDDEE
eukprot:GABV01001150.1.p2 GENE.GABV01001150.1~~GABV01001150.1.p2  ORF type:complete len:256 (+),score=107.13 GABV01001150.1:36-803(+)